MAMSIKAYADDMTNTLNVGGIITLNRISGSVLEAITSAGVTYINTKEFAVVDVVKENEDAE